MTYVAVAPEDFGAVGSGSVDDAPALQAAIDSAIASTKTVRLAPGRTYLLETGLVIDDDKSLIGDGTATLKLGANITAVTVTGSNVLVRGFKIEGQASVYQNNANNGVHVDWASAAGSNVRIEDVWVEDISGAGIMALASSGTASSGLVVRDCRITDVGTHGIIAQDYISNVRFSGNYVNATGLGFADRPGITASRDGSGVVVSDNIVIGSASALGSSVHGISIDSTSDATVTGNLVQGWKGYGIEVGFVEGGVFSGNSIEGCGAGIGISGDQGNSMRNVDCVIVDNQIRNCTGRGIYAFMTSANGSYFHQRITIRGNSVYDVSDGSSDGTGYDIQYVNDLILDVVGARDCFHSGVFLLDCPNHYLNAVGVTRNNLDGGLKPVSALTASGNTATATSTAHGYSTGDVVTVIGASPTEYNQTGAAITRIDNNIFTYALPRSGLANAAGTVQVGKMRSGAHAGVRVAWSQVALANRGRCRVGTVEAWGNGFRDYYDVNENGLTGLINGILYLPDVPGGPQYVANLTSGLSANVMDRFAIYGQNGKLAISYDDAGTQKYAVLDLGAGTGTWADGTTPP